MNIRKEFFKITENGRVFVDSIDAKTKLTIKGEEKFNEATTLIGIYCFYMMIVCIASAIMVWHRAFTFNMMSEKIALYIRYDLVWQLLSKDIGWYDTQKTGDILSRIANDTSIIQDGLSTNISMFFRSFVFIIASFIIMGFIQWKLTLVTFGGILPIVFISSLYGKRVKVISKDQSDLKAVLGTIAEEAISNIRTVKAFSTERIEGEKHAECNQKLYGLGKRLAVYSGFFSFFIAATMQGIMALVTYYGSVLFINGEIGIGGISAFLLYFINLLFNFIIVNFALERVYKVIGAGKKIL